MPENEFSATHGSPLVIGQRLEMSDGRILEVIRLDGKTAMGAQWYRMREIRAKVESEEPRN
jgi:hypothetical protein